MQTPNSIYQAIDEQCQKIQTCIEQDDTSRLLKHLKRRGVLLHQMNRIVESCSHEEQVLAKPLLEELQKRDRKLQAQLSNWREAVQSQMQKRRQQRHVAGIYRQPTVSCRSRAIT